MSASKKRRMKGAAKVQPSKTAPKLKTVAVGKEGMEAHQMGFGCMGITAFYGKPMEDSKAFDLLKDLHELGYNHFDTAEIYAAETDEGTIYNESVVGKYFQTVPRDSFTIATKYFPGKWTGQGSITETVNKAVDASLERLGLDCIDLYYCHRMPDTLEELLEWMSAVKELVKAGKIKYVGLSEVSPAWLAKAHEVHPITAIQQEWSLMTRNLEEKLVPLCVELGIAVVAYSPLSRNLLAGAITEAPKDWRGSCPRYSKENLEKNAEIFKTVHDMAKAKKTDPATLSLAWLLHKAAQQSVSVIPIPGTTKLEHAKQNLAALKLRLTKKNMETLEECAKIVHGDRYPEQLFGKCFENLDKAKKSSL